jgi:hypothetical protein
LLGQRQLPEQIQDILSHARFVEFEAREQSRELKAKSAADPAESLQRRGEGAVLQTSDRIGREAGSFGENFLSQFAAAPKTANVLTELPREQLFECIVLGLDHILRL